MSEVELNQGAVAPEASESPASEPEAAPEPTLSDEGLDDASLFAAAQAAAEALPSAEPPPVPEAPPATPPVAKVEEPPPATPPADDGALKAAEEARLQRLVDAQVAAHRAREDAKAAAQAQDARIAALEKRLGLYEGNDPQAVLEALQARGMDLEVLTGAALGAKNPEKLVLRQAMAEIKELKDARKADLDKREDDLRRAEARQAEVSYISAQVRPSLESKKSEFPYLYAAHGEEGVPQVIYAQMNRIYGERGPDAVPPPHVVARELEAKAKQYYEAIHAKATTATTAAPATTPQATKPKPKTLTNSLTQASPPEDDGDISDEALERAARAKVAAMAG